MKSTPGRLTEGRAKALTQLPAASLGDEERGSRAVRFRKDAGEERPERFRFRAVERPGPDEPAKYDGPGEHPEPGNAAERDSDFESVVDPRSPSPTESKR